MTDFSISSDIRHSTPGHDDTQFTANAQRYGALAIAVLPAVGILAAAAAILGVIG